MLSGCGISWCLYKNEAVIAKELTDNTIIKEADVLYTSENDPRQLYNYLIKYKESRNAEILWRIARAGRDLVLTGVDATSEEKKSLTYEAFEMAKKGLEIDDQNWGCHKWFAITLGDVGDYEGTKIKISNAYTIKDHLETALELNPKDATTAHCIGVWCKVFAELPWYQQKIASILFATPPTSSYEEAIELFELAEKIEPNFYSVNLLELGYCYKMVGDVKRAMLYLDKAAHYPAANEEDKQSAEKANALLKELLAKNKS